MEHRIPHKPILAQPNRSQVVIKVISLIIVVGIVLYGGITILINREAFADAILAFDNILWTQVIMLSLSSYLLRFIRWHSFIVALGYNVPGIRNFEIYLAAFAFTLTPGKIGETVRSVYLYRYGVSYPHSIGAFISERFLDLIAVGVLASLIIFIFPQYQFWLLGIIALFIAIVFLLRSRLLSLIINQLVKGSLKIYVIQSISAVTFLLSKYRLVGGVTLSLMAWTMQGISLYLIVNALNYDLPIVNIIAIYCLSILAGAASSIPGGLGATEVAMTLLLSAVGVGQSDAIIASVISRGLTLWFAVGIGAVAMAKTVLTQPQYLTRK